MSDVGEEEGGGGMSDVGEEQGATWEDVMDVGVPGEGEEEDGEEESDHDDNESDDDFATTGKAATDKAATSKDATEAGVEQERKVPILFSKETVQEKRRTSAKGADNFGDQGFGAIPWDRARAHLPVRLHALPKHSSASAADVPAYKPNRHVSREGILRWRAALQVL